MTSLVTNANPHYTITIDMLRDWYEFIRVIDL